MKNQCKSNRFLNFCIIMNYTMEASEFLLSEHIDVRCCRLSYFLSFFLFKLIYSATHTYNDILSSFSRFLVVFVGSFSFHLVGIEFVIFHWTPTFNLDSKICAVYIWPGSTSALATLMIQIDHTSRLSHFRALAHAHNPYSNTCSLGCSVARYLTGLSLLKSNKISYKNGSVENPSGAYF